MTNIFRLCRLFIVLVFCVAAQTTSAQGGLKEFFNNSEMKFVYLGIDFTKAKLINDPGANSFDIRNRLYGSINDVVVNEPKKYDIQGAFRKSNFSSDLTAVKARIEKINAEDIISSNTADFSRLTESDINAVVKSLNISGKEGIGLLFVMEGMHKGEKSGSASLWVTLIDLKSKKVLMTERFECKANGFGFRNYWASTIKIALDNIEKSKYKDWKAKYGS